jgi:hypothetical protein
MCTPARIRTAGGESGYEIECAANRFGRTIEQRKDAVASVLRAAPTVFRQQPVHHFVVDVELMAPAAIPCGDGLLGTADDIGEQHGRQDSLAQGRIGAATDEFKCFGG